MYLSATGIPGSYFLSAHSLSAAVKKAKRNLQAFVSSSCQPIIISQAFYLSRFHTKKVGWFCPWLVQPSPVFFNPSIFSLRACSHKDQIMFAMTIANMIRITDCIHKEKDLTQAVISNWQCYPNSCACQSIMGSVGTYECTQLMGRNASKVT